MMTLQRMVDATPSGATLDLGHAIWPLGLNPLAKYPLVINKTIDIVGDGAIVDVQHTSLRNRPALLVRGAHVRLLGDVIIHHDDNADVGNQDFEGQHGVETQGASDFVCNWEVENAPGSSWYFGKNPNLAPGTGWTKRVTMNAPVSRNAGRQHVALQAIDGFTILRPNFTRCPTNHSAFAFEPNGHDWGCKNGYVARGIVRGPVGIVFGSLGLGDHQPSYNLANVTFEDMHADGAPFTIRIVQGIGQRRGPVSFIRCSSDTVANQPTVRCTGVDGLIVVEYDQPHGMSVNLFDNHYCTKVVTSLA